MTTIDDDTLPQASARPKASPQADSGRLVALGAFLRAGAVFILLALLVVGFTIAEPAFINIANLMSVLQAVSVVAILELKAVHGMSMLF
ncbi:hypothetical protein ACCS96_25935, partial [Rhizobium ruizarguesonis]